MSANEASSAGLLYYGTQRVVAVYNTLNRLPTIAFVTLPLLVVLILNAGASLFGPSTGNQA